EPAPNRLELPLLFLNVDCDGVGDEVVRASAGGLRQPVQLSPDFGGQPHADRSASCVSHAHKLARTRCWGQDAHRRALHTLTFCGSRFSTGWFPPWWPNFSL